MVEEVFSLGRQVFLFHKLTNNVAHSSHLYIKLFHNLAKENKTARPIHRALALKSREGGTVDVALRLNAALFPNVRLLAVSEQSTRSATLTVAVTHPGTYAHNCCLTSNSDLTTIFPLSYRFSIWTPLFW